MNDEIKEILEKMFLNCDTQEEKNKVLDYITNLQQINNSLTTSLNKKIEEGINLQHTKEYLGEVLYEKDKELEKLNNKIKHYEETTTFGDYVKEVNLLIDYKSRVEKARIYIKKHLEIWETEDIRNIRMLDDEFDVEILLNILNGRSDE